MKKLLFALSLLIVIAITSNSCEGYGHCYTCYKTIYDPFASYRIDSLQRCDTDAGMSIYESQNNIIDSIGYGKSIECFKN